MSHFCRRAIWLLPFVVSASLFSAESKESASTLDAVFSEFIPAAQTSPDFSTPHVFVLTSDDFKASDLSAADVIELSPSVQIQDTGETGSYRSVSVRGASSQQTNIYVDGILLSGAGGEGGYLQQISMADVERIEVYPNSVPLQFSQSAPGGAVNIVRKKSAPNSAELLFEIGSYGHLRTNLTGQLRAQQWSTSAFLEATQAVNNFKFNNTHGTPLYLDDDTLEQRNNAQYEQLAVSLSAAHQQQERQLTLQLDGASHHKNLPHWNNANVENTFYNTQYYSAQASVNWNQWVPNLDSSLRAQSSLKDGHFSNTSGAIGSFVSNSYDALESHRVLHHSALSIPFALVAINNEIHMDQFKLNNDTRGDLLTAQQIGVNNSLGADVFVSTIFTVSSSIRHALYKDTQQQDNASDESKQVSHVSGQLGVRADVESFFLQLNGNQSIRQPSLMERFGNQGTFVGNIELDSEHALGVDASINLATENMAGSAAVFYRTIKQAIAPVYNSQGIGRYINLDSAEFSGIELQGEYRLFPFRLLSSATLQHSVAHSPFALFDQKAVPGYYPISTRQKLEWIAADQLTLDASYLFEAGLFYDRANSSFAPDKHQVDLSIKLKRAPIGVTFLVTNALNRAHLDFSRMPLPGRTFKLTFNYKFGALN